MINSNTNPEPTLHGRLRPRSPRRAAAACHGLVAAVLISGGLLMSGPAAADIPPAAPPAVQSPAPPVDGPQIFFPETRQEQKNVMGGTTVPFLFNVKNTGTKELKILDVQPTCHCTVASFDHTIAPGKSGTIRAMVDIPPTLSGSIAKTMVVYSNDPLNPTQTLFLISSVTPMVSVSPDKVVRVEYQDVKPITRVFTIQSHLKDHLKLDPPSTLGPVTTTLTPDPKQPNTYELAVTLTPPSTGGDAMGQIAVKTNVSGLPPLSLTFYALGDNGVTVSPAIIDYGTIYPDSGTPKAIASVFSRKSTFHITGVECDDPAIKLAFSRLDSRMSWYNLTASYAGGWTKGVHKGFLTLHTDLPSAPLVKVPFSADVQ